MLGKILPHIFTELCVSKFVWSLLLKILNTYFLKLFPYGSISSPPLRCSCPYPTIPSTTMVIQVRVSGEQGDYKIRLWFSDLVPYVAILKTFHIKKGVKCIFCNFERIFFWKPDKINKRLIFLQSSKLKNFPSASFRWLMRLYAYEITAFLIHRRMRPSTWKRLWNQPSPSSATTVACRHLYQSYAICWEITP